MKRAEKIFVLTLAMVFALGGMALALDQTVYPIKGKHKGQNITPVEAYKMMRSKPNVYLVDVRTRIEYQDIGHPVGAYNIPWKFYTTNVDKRGYKKVANPNFGKDLLARFNPKTDTLLLLCRSAKRTIAASTAAVDAGFNPENVYNVLGGFEGDKVKDKQSPFYGKRQVGGWRLEGLPWTYKMDPKFIYAADLK